MLAEFTSVAHKPASLLYLHCIMAWEDGSFSLRSHGCGLLLHALQPCLKSPPCSAFLQPAFAFSSHAGQTQLPLHAHVCMYLYTYPSPQKETYFARFNVLRVLLWTLPLLLQLWFWGRLCGFERVLGCLGKRSAKADFLPMHSALQPPGPEISVHRISPV